MNKNKKISGFTLIELLMVIAIIGVLAGILIPTVGAVRTQANIAASKAQLSNYVTAITMFKGEYGYYPFSDAQVDSGKIVNDLQDDFVETLSGRDENGESSSEGGNRRRIAFHSFSESEFFINISDKVDFAVVADRFNNDQIYIVIDGDGDNEITVPDTSGSGTKTLKSPITAYTLGVDTDDAPSAPSYYLYD
jgi:prepilin-type N-terminal cleavage/methylation domain-containing protein